MPSSDVVFRFAIVDLNQVPALRRDAKSRSEEEAFLRKQFAKWGIKETDVLQLTKPTLSTIITDPDGAKATVEWGEKLGNIFKSLQVTSSQIRSIFGTVRQIEAAWRPGTEGAEEQDAVRQLLLLKPKLAYQAKRHQPLEGLRSVLSPAIDLVNGNRDNFQRFVDFFEAIVAYHVAAGGQEGGGR